MNQHTLIRKAKGIEGSPPPFEYAMATVNDFVLDLSLKPLSAKDWQSLFDQAAPSTTELDVLVAKKLSPPFANDHLRWIAHFGRELGLFNLTKEALSKSNSKPEGDSMARLLLELRGLPPHYLTTSFFRQEEFFRKWAAAFGLSIDDESPATSKKNLAKCDYLNSLMNAGRAEKDLEKELKARQKVLEEIQRQAAANRGSYE